LCALLHAGVDELLDLGQLGRRVYGANVGVLVERIPYPEGREARLELVQERLIDALLNEETAPGAAHLALVEVDPVDDPLDCLVEWSIVGHDVHVLAPELQG